MTDHSLVSVSSMTKAQKGTLNLGLIILKRITENKQNRNIATFPYQCVN